MLLLCKLFFLLMGWQIFPPLDSTDVHGTEALSSGSCYLWCSEETLRRSKGFLISMPSSSMSYQVLNIFSISYMYLSFIFIIQLPHKCILCMCSLCHDDNTVMDESCFTNFWQGGMIISTISGINIHQVYYQGLLLLATTE